MVKITGTITAIGNISGNYSTRGIVITDEETGEDVSVTGLSIEQIAEIGRYYEEVTLTLGKK